MVKCISETTVLIQSETGKVRTSNVAPLRAWTGRDLTTEMEDEVIHSAEEEEEVVPRS